MIYTKNSTAFLYLTLFLISINTASATEIKATLDRNAISINESVQLTFMAAESPDEGPDFSPLKRDFQIINKNYISNSSWGTGLSNKSIQWILTLMPKQTGNLQIPSISFGDDSSQAIKLLVTKSKPVNSHKDVDIFMEVNVSPQSPYVQSQVIYTLRLFSKVQLSQARLTELELDNALVEKLGNVKKYTINREGVDFVVNELNYAIFPQKSGVLTIDPLVLTADVISRSQPRYNGFFSRQISKPRRVLSDTINLTVRPVPQSFAGQHWIAANDLIVKEKWSGVVGQMKVGEPLTRTLTILAIGNTVSQLPELHNKKEIDQLKTYPDQPVLKQQKRDENLIAFREEKIAYIPSEAGSYTLPAIEIPWFNTQTQTMEVAIIPETMLTAVATALPQKNNQITNAPSAAKIDESSPAEPVIHAVEDKFWMRLSILLAFGWLLTILFFFILRKSKQSGTSDNTKVTSVKEIKLKEIKKRLRQACKENNAPAAKNALLVWGKICFDSETLATTAPYCEARLRDEILRLNRSLYAKQAEAWQSGILFQAFSENNARRKIANKVDDALEPLHKV